MNSPHPLLLTLLIVFSISFGCTDIEAPRLSDDLTDVTDHDTTSPHTDTGDTGDTTPPQQPILDGENANVVFVSLTGSDVNGGLSSTDSKRTITEGIKRAKIQNRSYVLVATGEYTESITLEDGIHLLGGYAPDFMKRDPTYYKTTITGSETGTPAEYKTIIAQNLTRETTLSGFTVHGQSADSTTPPGASTFALWSLNSKNLIVQDSHFIAGEASRGANGKNALQATAADCSDVENTGGDGGTPIITDPCPDDGGQHQAPPGKPGQAGDGTGPDHAQTTKENGGTHICGQAKPSIDGTIGANGTDGGPGENSTPLTGDSLGMFSLTDNTWYPLHPEPPTKGENGSGGQGGGAGGNHNKNLFSGGQFTGGQGGIGGKGGKGGCGGAPGENGQSGGSSFGITVLDGNVSFENIRITLGAGGNGGDFGQSGEGSEGGYGITGLPGQSTGSNDTAGKGGWGGPGGKGGKGGKAIGGNGGHAIGLAFTNEATIEEISPITYTENSGEAGTPGTDGWDTSGLTITRIGIVKDTQEFPYTD